MITTVQRSAMPSRPLAVMPPLRRWFTRLFGRRSQAAIPLAGVAALVNEQRLGVTQVNAAGMCLAGYRGLLNEQDRFSFVLTLDGIDIVGDAVVAWRRHGGLGVAFYDLSLAERDRLAQWLHSRSDIV